MPSILSTSGAVAVDRLDGSATFTLEDPVFALLRPAELVEVSDAVLAAIQSAVRRRLAPTAERGSVPPLYVLTSSALALALLGCWTLVLGSAFGLLLMAASVVTALTSVVVEHLPRLKAAPSQPAKAAPASDDDQAAVTR